MKKVLSIAVAVSLVLNAVLAYRYFASGQLSEESAAPVKVDAPAAAAVPAIDAKAWSKLEHEDLAQMADRLREAGFPPVIMRAIVSAQLSAEYQARREALDPDAANRPFWKNFQPDAKTQAALRELQIEQRKRLRELFGADADSDDPMSQLYRNRGLAGLSAEKSASIRQLVEDYNQRRTDLYSAYGGGPITFTAAERQKMLELEKSMHADIAKILTPQELETYDLQAGTTAQSLRYQLSAFNATEQEFLAIYRLQRDFDEKHPMAEMIGGGNMEQMRQYAEARNQLQEQIKLALGPERATDYERAIDFNYRQTKQLVERLELPAETTNQLYAVQKDFEKRRQDVMRSGGSREDLNARMTELQQQAIDKVTPLLGSPRAVEAYKQYGGSWIRSMVPRVGGAGGTAMSVPAAVGG